MTRHKKLQVIHIITKLELGGAQKVCLSILEGLNKEGHLTFLISGNDGVLTSYAQHVTRTILLPSFKREVTLKSLWNELKTCWKLIQELRILRSQYPDIIVHTHSTKAGIMGRWAAFCARIKTRIHTIHGYAFHTYQPWYISWSIYSIELITSFITSHFICVSSHDITLGKKYFPAFSNKYSLIRAAVNQEQFYRPATIIANDRKTHTPFIFGTVACFKKQKNIIDLLRAFHETHTRTTVPIKLEIIGDGILRPAIEQWINEHHLTNHITLLSWQNNVTKHMLTWQAFTLSSLWEGLPCAIIEARLLKLPVIAYNTGGISDVIKHERNGLLIKQCNWKELSNAMTRIINDKRLYKRLVSYKDDLQAFDQRVMLKQHITLYQKINL
jgi:glycosyltransferase involved in cell wall biosynthesis